VLVRRGAHAFFVFGFAKSSRAAIGMGELRAFRRLAALMLAFDAAALAAATANGTLKEIRCDGEAIPE